MTTPPDLLPPAQPSIDVPTVPAPEIRPYTGTEDRPGQSTPEVQPDRRRPEAPVPPGPSRVPPPPDREVEPPRR